jgi:hypothetical protein
LKIPEIDPTSNEIMKAPHNALMMEMILPKGETENISP